MFAHTTLQGSTLVPRLFAAGVLLMLVLGCDNQNRFSDAYGRRAGPAGTSMNGTRVLSHLFEANDNRVRTSRRLGKSVSRADVVVWVPDTYELPSDTVCQYLEQWLASDTNRVVVYVGRDYDSTVDYWRDAVTGSDDEHRVDVQKRLAERTSRRDLVLAGLAAEDECRWFRLQRLRPPRRIQDLSGPWTDAPGVTQVDLELHARLQPAEGAAETDDPLASWTYQRLLYSGDVSLAVQLRRRTWGSGRIIVVPDGSWLLNYPLVDHEHRRLAGKLVQACGSGRRVVFLESGEGGPPLTNEKQTHHMLKAFTTPPFRSILLHLTVLGMIYCLAVYPIFGRAKQILAADQSDFGRHIRAMGRLLSQGRDAAYADAAIEHYREQVKQIVEEPSGPQADVQGRTGDPFARTALTTESETRENDNA